MRFTRVLLRKGQLRTPKNYQNPEAEQGVLTHTRNVEIVPKLPKPRGHEASLHKGAVRRVMQIPTPNDVRKEMEIKQATRVTMQLLQQEPFLTEEQEKKFHAILKEQEIVAKPEKPTTRLAIEKAEGRSMDEIVWKMRRKDGRSLRPGDFADRTSGYQR